VTFEKFYNEIETLKKFFPIYCNDKHTNQFEKEYSVNYLDENITFKISLCNECHTLLEYAINRLQECPHEIKPRCRKCESPCYEKDKFKQMAKMMRYSGMKLGLTKAAKRLKSIFKI